MDLGLIAQIISVILALLSAFLGYKWGYFKHKFSALRTLIDHLDEAWKDEKITDQELEVIINDLKRMIKEC